MYPFFSHVRHHFDSTLYTRTPRLLGAPQLSGMIHKVTTKSPKKPNSGIRKVAKIKIHYHLQYTRLTARLTGSYNRPVKFNRVLVRGGRANDLPGVGYTVVRGAFDCAGLTSKHRRRSIYGVKIPKYLHTHVRRKLRKTFTKLKL